MFEFNVLSLFDGMSCGQLALRRAGIKYDNYYASEVDKYAIKVTQTNFPDTIQLGDVRQVKGANLPKIDLLMGGSPCQGFSFAGAGLNFSDDRSKLFFEFVRLLDECKPKYFLLENVKMKKVYKDIISSYMDVRPIQINSALVSAQNRVRLYWTNIAGVKQPKDKGILLKDIIEHGSVRQDKSYCIDACYFKGGSFKNKAEKLEKGSNDFKQLELRLMVFEKPHGWNTGGITGKDKFGSLRECTSGNYAILDNIWKYKSDEPSRLNEKASTIRSNAGGITRGIGVYNQDKSNWRKLMPVECERLQTVPDNYTNHVSNAQRYKMLGNGWTVAVIAHILKNLYKKPRDKQPVGLFPLHEILEVNSESNSLTIKESV